MTSPDAQTSSTARAKASEGSRSTTLCGCKWALTYASTLAASLTTPHVNSVAAATESDEAADGHADLSGAMIQTARAEAAQAQAQMQAATDRADEAEKRARRAEEAVAQLEIAIAT